jgi:hypothetical protein
MSRALIVTTDGNPFKFNFWCKNYDRFNLKNEVDKVYVTVGCHLSWEIREVFVELCKERNFKLLLRERHDGGMARLAEQISFAIEEVEEDYFCSSEDDIWMVKSGTLDERFKRLESGEFKLIGTLRQDLVNDNVMLLPDPETIMDQVKTATTSFEPIFKYCFWSSWLFGKTQTFKDLQVEFAREASKDNYMMHGSFLHSFENTPNIHAKKYQSFIPYYRLFWGNWWAGTKLSMIHPDWVFTDNSCQDEVFGVLSFILFKRLGRENISLERQNKIMTNQQDYFDIKNKTSQNWSNKRWVHCVGSSGWDGMYGFIRDENNIPIFYTDAFCVGQDISGKFNKQIAQSGFRYAMNFAFVKSFDKPNRLLEFKSDYEKYLHHHGNIDNIDMNLTNYMTDTLIANVL